jgi:hypothetical protein
MTQLVGSATITIGSAVRIPTGVVVSTPTATIASGGITSVSATVNDASGVISGTTVSFDLNDCIGGSWDPTSCVTITTGLTNVTGVATVNFYAASVDNTSVLITASTGTISDSVNLLIGESIVISAQTPTISSSGSTTVTATVSDGSGVVLSGVTVTFNLSDVSGSSGLFGNGLTSETATTDASGVASVTFTAATVASVTFVDATASYVAPSGTISDMVTIEIGP